MYRGIILLTFFWLIAGCSGDNLKQGLYESLRVHSDLQSTPSERIGKPEPPTYNEYQQLKK